MHPTFNPLPNLKNDGAFASLTARENTILAQLSQGYANKEIAVNLSISVPTVRTHLRNIYGKIRARSRTEAMAKYFQITLQRLGAQLSVPTK